MSSEPRRWTVALTLVVLTGLAATAVAYFWARSSPAVVPAREAPQSSSGFPETLSIVLPHDDPEAPLGPHRETFQVACTVCHSTRLVLGQPRLSRKKWGEVVQKMVKVYGAPLRPEEADHVADYLAAVRGK